MSSFRSPESVEMDEIMAAMVLTSLSCSPVVQSPPQADPGPGQSSFTNTQLHHYHLMIKHPSQSEWKKNIKYHHLGHFEAVILDNLLLQLI